MQYKNPIIRGFNPDPSICEANGKYYLVTSTFQFYPGVAVYESKDLINWTHINNCLTEEDHSYLNVPSSSGIFAPTIRFNQGTFYVTTTNNHTREHFIVSTKDIYGKWSKPVVVDQDGIDPSLYFEGEKVVFTSNGKSDDGKEGIIQSLINIETGEKLTKSIMIWPGTGGRYLEAPHLYKIGKYYYLFASEGGTEFGHFVIYARSENMFGPFESYQNNPLITNRNQGGYVIQGVGHGDLITNSYGNYYFVHLGFRQIDKWLQYHHLGRETFLTPLKLNEEGWFESFDNGVVLEEYSMKGNFEQVRKNLFTFENTNFKISGLYVRYPNFNNYEITNESIKLTASEPLSDMYPTFIGLRQEEFIMSFKVDISENKGLAGISAYMDESHHYDLYIKDNEVNVRIKIGPIEKVVYQSEALSNTLKITSDNLYYYFYNDNKLVYKADTKYLSSEVASGFTGVVIGMFVEELSSTFTNLEIKYEE